jgi:tight adherence protein C
MFDFTDTPVWIISVLWLVCGAAAVLYAGEALRNIRYVRLADGRTQERQIPALIKLFLPLTPNLTGLFKAPFFAATRKRLDRQLIAAGFEGVIASEELLALQVLMGMIAFPAGLVFLKVGLGWLVSTRVIVMMALLVAVLGYLYPWVWLQSERTRRHRAIERALPHVLDLLTLSVEAGMDFMAGLRRIIDRRRLDPLGEELLQVFHEIKVGKTRRQALRDMGQRVDNADVTIVTLALIQADELGVGLGTVLRIQADQMRQRRFQRAEKLAHEAPVKMLFPLILFIFPSVIIILLGPFLVKVIQSGVLR